MNIIFTALLTSSLSSRIPTNLEVSEIDDEINVIRKRYDIYHNISLIKNINSTISYSVKCRGGHLEAILSKFGLKQGGVLSALLFNLYI